MRKKLIVLIALLFTFALVGSVFAAGEETAGADFSRKMQEAKSMSFAGQVLSHDVRCHCFVLKTKKGEMTILDDYAKFMDEYNQATGLKIGSMVMGKYKVIDHINYATDIDYAKAKE